MALPERYSTAAADAHSEAMPDLKSDKVVADTKGLVDKLLYNASYWAAFTALTFGWSLRATGRQNVPKEGPLLLAANHRSNIDPVAVGTASPRYLSFMAKQELFEVPGLGRLISALGATPVNRKFARAGLQEGRTMLKEGKAVLLFPEGERSRDDTFQPLKPGITSLMKQGAPVVPVGIAGTHKAWGKGKMPHMSPLCLPPTDASIGVAFGKPISPGEIADMERQQMLETLHARIAECIAVAEDIRRK